jgi:hypothetical protein
MLVNEHFKVNLSINEIFIAPTVASMASLIQQMEGKGTWHD